MKPMLASVSLALAPALALAVRAAPEPHAHHAAPAAATKPQPAALDAQLAALRAGIARYADFEVAQREGWKKFGVDGPLVGEHWYLPVRRGAVDYRAGQPIDFARPSSLMYSDIGGKRVLTGVTFNVRIGDGEPVPQGFAGDGDTWHVHDFRAFFAAALQGRPMAQRFAQAIIDDRWGGRQRLAMIHVWAGSIPNPDGVFAHYNRLVPYRKLGLPDSFADGAGIAAARGLNLATKHGCAVQIDGAARMAGVAADSKARLHKACAAAAAHVREGLGAGTRAEVNAMAEHGWAMFDAAWNRELTAGQKARIAAITEHDHPVPPQGQPTHRHH